VNEFPKSLAIDAALRRFLDPQADPADCFTPPRATSAAPG